MKTAWLKRSHRTLFVEQPDLSLLRDLVKNSNGIAVKRVTGEKQRHNAPSSYSIKRIILCAEIARQLTIIFCVALYAG
ncbi:MAG: DUF2773 domain-containing protein [Escherichia sp.]